MTVDTELALAASRVRLLSEQIPENHRPDIAAEWTILEDELDCCRSDGGREMALIEWRSRVEGRLAQLLAHAPLEELQVTDTKAIETERRSDND